jgi:AAHS family benzoate transporter-like MFS transporter
VAGLLAIVAVVGLGTSGTQVLIYGLVSNYYRTNVRGAGVAWCAGFGRLGGVVGPLVVGYMQQAELPIDTTFQILAGIAAVGALLTLVLPMGRNASAEPAPALAAAKA